jgi:cystathionine beta-lyase/cystathionine gamma-synthase
LRTLPLRLAQQAKSALEVARWLQTHSMVHAVHHPALFQGEQGRLFETYFSGSSSLFSFELLGTRDHVRAFVDALRLFRLGVSWGGHESLVYPAAIGLDLPGDPNPNRVFGTTANLVRLHVGLEASHDLIDDLEQALRVARECIKDIPIEEFEKLPKDGAHQHDHYLYGTPKRNDLAI